MSASIEVHARRYLRLFPLWMRADRGEEVLGLVLDQVPEHASRLPLRSRLDLLRAGLHARRRGTPPWLVWSRVSDTSRQMKRACVPVEWRPWLASVVLSRWLLVVVALLRTAQLFYIPLIYGLAGLWPRWWLLSLIPVWFVSAGVFALTRRAWWRANLLAANGLSADGRPLPPHCSGVMWTKPAVANVWLLPVVVAFTATASIATPIAALVLRGDTRARSDDPAFASALVAGTVVLAAAWALRRVTRIGRSSVAESVPPQAERSQPLVHAVAAAVILGGATAMGGAMFVGALHPLALATVPAANLVVLGVTVVAQRLSHRPLGLWDVCPSLAPTLVVRPLPDLPAPPGQPGRPAVG